MNSNVKKVNKLNFLSAIVLSTGIVAGATAILPSSTTAYAAAANTVQQTTQQLVQVEGHTVKTVKGLNGSKLISLKEAAQAAGVKLSKDAKTNTVILTQGKNRAILELDSDSAVVKLNGSSIGDRYEAKTVAGIDYVAPQAFAIPFGYQVRTDFETGNTLISRNELNEVSITAATLKSPLSKGSTKINIVYPVVSGLGNAQNEKMINTALKSHAEQFLNTAAAKIKKSNGPAQGSAYEFYTAYKVTYNQNGYISFVLDDYTFLGGAHGTSGATGMTFTLGNGKSVKLANLLKDEKNAEKTVQKMVQEQIEKDAGSQGYTLKDFKEWTKGTTSYLDNFYMTYDGVTILIPVDHTAPSAMNVFEFSLPGMHLLKSDLQ